jgi:flagellar biosynthetic protein FliR
MILLFSLIVMRMTGALAFNSIWSRNGFPPMVRGMFIFMLSAMFYVWTGGTMVREPGTRIEYAVMLLKELALGASLGFGMELTLFIFRFATSIMDFSMGLNMAQIYDPEMGSQSSITSALYLDFIMLIFFTSDAHLTFFRILFGTAEYIPFGSVQITKELASFMLKTFCRSAVLGLQLAFPVMGIELLTEIALGILMRVIPQINMFSINFQAKIIIGMLMLLFLFHPMMDVAETILNEMPETMQNIITLMGSG